jgi:hypothetical protein
MQASAATDKTAAAAMIMKQERQEDFRLHSVYQLSTSSMVRWRPPLGHHVDVNRNELSRVEDEAGHIYATISSKVTSHLQKIKVGLASANAPVFLATPGRHPAENICAAAADACIGPRTAGIIPCVLDDIFSRIGKNKSAIKFKVTVGLIEIYDNQANELLNHEIDAKDASITLPSRVHADFSSHTTCAQ